MMNIQQIISNPIFKMMINSNNPQEAMNQIISQNPNMKNNALVQNAINMINNGDSKGIETMARNLCQSQGIDINQLINSFNNIKR